LIVAQFDIYRNPGRNSKDVPFLLSVQNDHISSRTGATVVIPLRTNALAIETLAPKVRVGDYGEFVMSTDDLFAIEASFLKAPIGSLELGDRGKVRPALDKLFGDY